MYYTIQYFQSGTTPSLLPSLPPVSKERVGGFYSSYTYWVHHHKLFFFVWLVFTQKYSSRIPFPLPHFLTVLVNFGGRWNKLACQQLRPLHWGRPISVTKFSVRSGSMVKISSSGTVLIKPHGYLSMSIFPYWGSRRRRRPMQFNGCVLDIDRFTFGGFFHPLHCCKKNEVYFLVLLTGGHNKSS